MSLDYCSYIYSKSKRPETKYPAQLIEHLFCLWDLKEKQKFCEVGCGRGEFMRHFQKLGLEVEGVDLAPSAKEASPDINIMLVDIAKENIPVPDNTYDIVYSKSFVEHLTNPEIYFREAYRILKPGGLLLTLVPDWESNYKIYFDDFSHKTPFTTVTLEDVYGLCGFENISVNRFRQLPCTWKYPLLNLFCATIAPFIPIRTKSIFLRFSRELMIMGGGYKPQQ